MPGVDPLSAIELAGAEWSVAWKRCKAAIEGRSVPIADPGSAVDGAPVTAAEQWARSVSGHGNLALGLTLPLALIASSVMAQGALWVRAPLAGGDWLRIPVIMQGIVVAPSGYGKSTVLDPLVDMMLRLHAGGYGRRSGYVKGILDQGLADVDAAAAGAKTAGQIVDAAVWDAARAGLGKIVERGYCHRLIVDQATPEGVRRALLRHGSMTGVLTAEPDILREVGAYAKDAGSLRFFLDGWGGSRIGVDRAEREMVIPRASVPFAILMQPQSFDAFNRDRTDGGAGGGVGGVAADSAIGRGFFGRSWLIRIAGFTVTEKSFGLGTGDEGGSGVDGALGPVGGALLALEGVLEQVLMRGEQYRARLGVFIGWQEALGGAPGMTDAVGVVPVPGLPARDWLTLTAEAVGEYGVVQDIRTALSAAVQRLEVEASGSETVLMPMASRWTQHVLRVAAVLTLLADPGAKVIEGWAVRDAGQRIVPWLLEHWCREMTDYQEAALAATLEQEIKFNPRGADLTPLGQVVEVMVGIAKDQLAAGIAAEPSWSRGEVLAKLRNKVRGAARTAVYKSFADAFDQMIAEGVLKKNTAEPKPGKGGRPAVWFTPGPIVGKYFKNAW